MWGCVLAGCVARAPTPSAPPSDLEWTPAPPADSMPPAWIRRSRPTQAVRYRIRWRLQTRTGATTGRAVATIAPPDSLRFEYHAPFGRRGAAVIVGGDVVSAEPQKDVRRLIEVAPLLWAALGIPWSPHGIGEVGARPTGEPAGWRITWADTVITYVRRAGSPRGMTAQMLAGHRAVGTAYVAFGEPGNRPTKGRIQFVAARSLLTFVVDSVELEVDLGAAWPRP